MKTTTRLFLPRSRAGRCRRPPCSLIAGCRGEHSPGESGHDDEDHAGHVIPAHKPKTFPDAVRRLRELNDRDRPRPERTAGPRHRPDEKTLQHRARHRQLAPRDRRRQRHARGAVERGQCPVRGDRRGLPGDACRPTAQTMPAS